MTATARSRSEKGYRLEEVLRNYFLQAGYFVVRSVPFRLEGKDVTDIDLWLYERSTGSARRRHVVDAKSKSRPKAVERLLWVKGLAEGLGVDGAYVATTDTRPVVRKVAKRLGVLVIDGNDLQRIQAGGKKGGSDRVFDEELWKEVRAVDENRRNKKLQAHFEDAKASLIENFGAGTVVRSLEAVRYFASEVVAAHPGSPAARVAGRLTYISAALVAIGLDGVRLDATFGSLEDLRALFVNAIRFGDTDRVAGSAMLRVATRLVERFADNGSAIAKMIEDKARLEYDSIPAEIIADEVMKMGGTRETLFSAARELERMGYHRACPSFDGLDVSARSFLGALLDFSQIERKAFAEAWQVERMSDVGQEVKRAKSLFEG